MNLDPLRRDLLQVLVMLVALFGKIRGQLVKLVMPRLGRQRDLRVAIAGKLGLIGQHGAALPMTARPASQ